MANLKEKNAIRVMYTNKIMTLVRESGEDALPTKDNKFMFPFVYENGEEGFFEVTITLKEKSEGSVYDGYEEHENYKAEKERKAKENAEKLAQKKAKAERDRLLREEKAKKKTERLEK